MITLYGIPNCDSVKKARQWLEQQAIDYRFHDFRRDGLTLEHINTFLKHCDWALLLNRRSSTWKTLTEAQRNALSPETVAALLVEYPTLIKRPVLETDNTFLVGFKPETYQCLIKTATD